MSTRAPKGDELTLQFKGELAEESLDVPSYIPEPISGATKYDWFSMELSL
jgi:hypothetical protein